MSPFEQDVSAMRARGLCAESDGDGCLCALPAGHCEPHGWMGEDAKIRAQIKQGHCDTATCANTDPCICECIGCVAGRVVDQEREACAQALECQYGSSKERTRLIRACVVIIRKRGRSK